MQIQKQKKISCLRLLTLQKWYSMLFQDIYFTSVYFRLAYDLPAGISGGSDEWGCPDDKNCLTTNPTKIQKKLFNPTCVSGAC